MATESQENNIPILNNAENANREDPSVETCIGSTQSCSLSYLLEPERSIFSDDVSRWLGSDDSMVNTAAQRGRVITAQQSSFLTASSLCASAAWYVVAMALPLLNGGTRINWNCTQSWVANAAQTFTTQLTNGCARARSHIRSMAQDQILREIFATALDIVLVIYAIGFLILSMCQASVFSR